MIIDFHAHIYPEKIAEKASVAISKFYENAAMAYHGRSDELIEEGANGGVTHFVVHSAATKADQVESVNNFIIRETEKHKEFIGFGTIHPDYENFEEELVRIKNAGLKGIKILKQIRKKWIRFIKKLLSLEWWFFFMREITATTDQVLAGF